MVIDAKEVYFCGKARAENPYHDVIRNLILQIGKGGDFAVFVHSEGLGDVANFFL